MNPEQIVETEVSRGLPNFLRYYHENYTRLKSEDRGYDTQEFNRRFGLFLTVPENWSIVDAINAFLASYPENYFKNPLIIYSDTENYTYINKVIGNKTSYISWHEIYTALNISPQNASPIKRIRNEVLIPSDIVFVLDCNKAPSAVLENLQGYIDGCMIVFG